MHRPKFKNYTDYKPYLREEFSFKCVYCETNEPELGGSKSFHVDHYKPKSKFPHLETSYFNLLYACRDCNQYKSNYWPSPLDRLLSAIIFNPRIHTIENHIDKSEPAWGGKTNQGRWNIKRLRLSSQSQIERRIDRQNMEKTIETLKKHLSLEKQGLQKAQDKNNQTAITEFEKEISSLNQQIDTLTRKISGRLD